MLQFVLPQVFHCKLPCQLQENTGNKRFFSFFLLHFTLVLILTLCVLRNTSMPKLWQKLKHTRLKSENGHAWVVCFPLFSLDTAIFSVHRNRLDAYFHQSLCLMHLFQGSLFDVKNRQTSRPALWRRCKEAAGFRKKLISSKVKSSEVSHEHFEFRDSRFMVYM